MQREHVHLLRLQWAACEDVLSSHDNMLAVINRTRTKRKRNVDYCSRADLTDAFNDAFCHRNIFKCTYVNVHAKALTKHTQLRITHSQHLRERMLAELLRCYDHHWAFALFITKVQQEAYLHGQHKYTHSLLHIYKHAYASPLAVIYIDRK